jgi:hypothetical protein
MTTSKTSPPTGPSRKSSPAKGLTWCRLVNCGAPITDGALFCPKHPAKPRVRARDGLFGRTVYDEVSK